MIEDATPKEGLETGSLEGASGLSTRDRVARNYFDDLTGKNGERALFDTFGELAEVHFREKLGGLTFSSGDGTQIFGTGRHFAIQTPQGKKRKRGEEGSVTQKGPAAPWSLLVSGDPGEFTVNVGTILQSGDSISQTISCTNPSEVYEGEPGQILAIKITAEVPVSYTIVLLDDWPEDDGYQVTYTGTMAGSDFTFVERHYPLWVLVDEATATSTPIGPGVHGEQICFNHLQIQYGIYRTPDDEFVQLPGFTFAHQAVSV